MHFVYYIYIVPKTELIATIVLDIQAHETIKTQNICSSGTFR